ncbi:MAG: hypothetical protein ACLS9I_07395 [Adlercreutzia equolifaciens]
MKKSTFVVVVVLALALCVPAVAFAALSPSSPMAIGSRSAAATCPNYADRNANGASDRHENGACPGYTDADGDGVCDNYAVPRSNGKAAPDNGDASASMTLPPLRLRPRKHRRPRPLHAVMTAATLMPTAMASATTTKTARALGMWMPTATAYATTAPVLERPARATWMPTAMASATTTAAGTAMVMAMAVTMAAVTAALAKQTLRVREICP